jgi:hypothetical protein
MKTMSETDTPAPSWFNKGYGGVKTEEERVASLYGPSRFWMPPESKSVLVFVDNQPACIREHNPKMNGSWKNWVTCIREMYPEDPACCEKLGGDYQSYYVGYYTVIDCNKWTDKKGNSYQFEMKLYPAKIKSLKLLEQKSLEDWGGSLAGKVIKVRRTDGKSASVGNDFTLDREADLEKLWGLANYKGKKIADLFEKATQDEDERAKLLRTFEFQKGENGELLPQLPVFNYMNLLNPKRPAEMRAHLNAGRISDPDSDNDSGTSGTNSSGSAGEADENIPF